MKTRTIIAICAMAAITQAFNMANAAQKKEGPSTAPIVVSVDAQKKEAPTPGPSVTAAIREWLGWIGVLPAAQKKE
jgi:hypothetical protein